MQTINSIVLIGAGNVAFHLGKAFHVLGKNILQVYSRSEASSAQLANLFNTDHTNKLEKLNLEADLYIIAVSDDAILSIVEKLKLKDQLVVHTSGSVGMNILSNCSSNYGVFYPLQTFSKLKEPNFKTIPICIEANNNQSIELLKIPGNELSDKVEIVDSIQRKALHLAAVFACNFPNLMYTASEILLNENNLSFDMLKPLVAETADKVQHILPSEAQTGPAHRDDLKIMNEHVEMLHNHKQLEEIYLMLSRIIKKQKNNEQL